MNPLSKKFVPVMITPFNQRMNIDWDGLSALIDFYLEAGVKGLFANCLSSEMYSITEDERLEMIQFIVSRTKGILPVVATGSFGRSPEDRADSVKKTYDTGVDAVILISSHFAAIEEPDEKLLSNIEALFDMTGNIPLGLYECPAPYKRILSPQVFGSLLESGRMLYHKDTSIDLDLVRKKIRVMNEQKKDKMEFYDAHTPNTLDSLEAGAKGMSSIAGNFYPEIMVWMCNHFSDPNQQGLVKWLQSEITTVDPLIHQGYPLSSKYFLRKRGLPVQEFSRVHPLELTVGQKIILDQILIRFREWCERLEI